MASTIAEALAIGSDENPAIAGVERELLTHGQLRKLIGRLGRDLRTAGIGPQDRVAIVLPNGPELAIAFLAVSSHATAAPLSPAYTESEFRFYLEDLGAKALLTLPNNAEAAHSAAGKTVVRVALRGSGNSMRFDAEHTHSEVEGDSPGADAVALLLHTSGTTSRPKLVPLTQRNLATSAKNIGTSLALTSKDCCLNVMPLFHIHGLVAAVLSSLAAGGSVACTPGFDGFRFFRWIEEFQPTWYTAVPTMHQIILQRSKQNADLTSQKPFRFMRSSSASLPPSIMVDLEKAFGTPLIEAYGMTEAAHQMAANPLPPAMRKPGSVGMGTGVAIAIFDEMGSQLTNDEIGEVVIRGENVTRGYEANGEANASAFTDGWFRTGDQGYLDKDGYLFLTGRLKEIINRGGEKISPREIDEVLIQHDAIEQCVAFAMPHERLGEEVAAAVVLEAGTTLSEHEVREFAATQLADFKVPKKVVFLDEIPKGPTGKLQRIGLAKQLGLIPG